MYVHSIKVSNERLKSTRFWHEYERDERKEEKNLAREKIVQSGTADPI